MKQGIQWLILLSAVSMLLSGCDFFRSLAGRPTSESLDAKKAALAAARSKELAAVDTTALPVKDTTAAIDTMTPLQTAVAQPEPRTSAVNGSVLVKRYYIVIGSFSSEKNAGAMAATAETNGYPAIVFPYKDMYAVGICGTDSLDEAAAALTGIRGGDIFPSGSWILTNR